MTARIRLITSADLPAVVALQDSCYDNTLYEPATLLAERLASAADSCWLIENSLRELLAYLFAYPAAEGSVTPLAQPFAVSATPQVLYLHDMAVSPLARGQALATRLLAHAEQYAIYRQLTKLALVAVQGSESYWQQHGFVTQQPGSVLSQQALASYIGQDARYMQKVLPRLC